MRVLIAYTGNVTLQPAASSYGLACISNICILHLSPERAVDISVG